MPANDLTMPVRQGGRTHNHDGIRQLPSDKSHAGQYQSQPLDAVQGRPFPDLTLQDEYLLAQRRYLAVAVVSKQPQDQNVAGGEQNQHGMPKHEGRMTAGLAEVKPRLDSQRPGMLAF